jgi:hypothetical protein
LITLLLSGKDKTDSINQGAMDDEFRQSIHNQIKKSGFPLELYVIDSLREKELVVYPNLSFADSNNQVHEIDALAMLDSEKPSSWPYGAIGLTLIVECKKAKEKPWVFFQDFSTSFQYFGLGVSDKAKIVSDLTVKESWPILVGSRNTTFNQHHYNSPLPIARTYLEAFKNPDQPSDIYKAIKSIWYAMTFWHNTLEHTRSSIETGKQRTLMCHGLIVVDGKLIIAQRQQEDDYEVSEVDHVLVRTIDCLTKPSNPPFPLENEIVIDVITKQHLDSYIELCRKDLKALVGHMLSLQNANWIEALEKSPGEQASATNPKMPPNNAIGVS